jgi:hypothetical protein
VLEASIEYEEICGIKLKLEIQMPSTGLYSVRGYMVGCTEPIIEYRTGILVLSGVFGYENEV